MNVKAPKLRVAITLMKRMVYLIPEESHVYRKPAKIESFDPRGA